MHSVLSVQYWEEDCEGWEEDCEGWEEDCAVLGGGL